MAKTNTWRADEIDRRRANHVGREDAALKRGLRAVLDKQRTACPRKEGERNTTGVQVQDSTTVTGKVLRAGHGTQSKPQDKHANRTHRSLRAQRCDRTCTA